MLLVQYVGGKILLDVFVAPVHIKVSNPGKWVDDMAATGAEQHVHVRCGTHPG